MNGEKIEGLYEFEGYYSKEDNILYPGKKKVKTFIKDKYEISIFKKKGKYFIEEIGGRIEKIADRHINPDNTCCLGIFESEDISIVELFNDRIFSYFYSNSFYEKFKKYPYGEYSHGEKGVFEKIGEIDDIESNKIIINNYLSKEWKYMIGNSIYYKKDLDLNIKKYLKTEIALKGYKKTKNILKNPLFNF